MEILVGDLNFDHQFIELRDLSTEAVPTGRTRMMFNSLNVTGNIPCKLQYTPCAP